MSITYDQEWALKLFPQRSASRSALFMGTGTSDPESSECPRFSESIVADARVQKYLGHRARNPLEHTLVMDTGCQRCIRFSLSKKLVHRTNTELLLEVKVKFTVVPSLRK